MCVVSNIGDRYRDRDGWPWAPEDPLPPYPSVPQPFQKHWDDYIRNKNYDDLEKRVQALEELLRKGKEFDTENGEPDCELDEKREALRKIAEELGIEIQFP